jgi:peptidylprolyl isomerase domain and WD repeat-containing protein 1
MPSALPCTAVTQVAVAHGTEFFITASVDGHIKFWKKQPQGVEFAKHFKVRALHVLRVLLGTPALHVPPIE